MFNSNVSLGFVLRCEAMAYPEAMRSMQDCYTWQDVADYCECKYRNLHVLGIEDRWYCLIAVHGRKAEICDLAKVPGSGIVGWCSIIAYLHRLGVRRVTLDARASTSYTVIMRLAARMRAYITTDKKWQWNGEVMHELEIAI